MAARWSTTLKNAQLDAYAGVVGSSPVLEFRAGAPAAAITDAPAGTLLASLVLPSAPFAAASGGVLHKAGTWSGTGVAAGSAGHYRLLDANGVCHEDGTVTATGGGGDIEVDNVSVAPGQGVTVTTLDTTAPAGPEPA